MKELLDQAKSVYNPSPLEYFRLAAERVQRDLCGDSHLDSRHFLLSCLVGKAFLGPDRCLGPNDHLTNEQLIGYGNDSVMAMRAANIDVVTFISQLRESRSLLPEPSFLAVVPDVAHSRYCVFKMAKVGEFAFSSCRDTIFPASMGLLPQSTAKSLDAIAEFEDLINSVKTNEPDFQRFFELHPEFLLCDEHITARPGVLLCADTPPGLKPDFFLQRRDTNLWDLAELKKHTARLARGRETRRGLSAAVHSAWDQLKEYRNYFFDETKAAAIREAHGIDVFWPRLTLIIGRDSGFGSYRERQRVVPPELRLLTYDDVLAFAKHRSLVLPFMSKDSK
jgi:hypothetical protein